MTKPEFDDETLMAFADGELDEATAAAVEQAMERDDELIARVAMFMETRARAKAEMAPLLEQPVPPELEQAVRGMVEASQKAPASQAAPLRVTPFKPARRASRFLLPLAASLAATVAAGFIGYQIGNAERPAASLLAGVTDPAVIKALQSLASGEEGRLAGGEGRISMVSSFTDQEGTFCREYEIDSARGSSLVAVSCLESGQWATRFAVAAPAGGDGYAPASSMEALEAYLSAINAGPALSQEQEAGALAGLR